MYDTLPDAIKCASNLGEYIEGVVYDSTKKRIIYYHSFNYYFNKVIGVRLIYGEKKNNVVDYCSNLLFALRKIKPNLSFDGFYLYEEDDKDYIGLLDFGKTVGTLNINDCSNSIIKSRNALVNVLFDIYDVIHSMSYSELGDDFGFTICNGEAYFKAGYLL